MTTPVRRFVTTTLTGLTLGLCLATPISTSVIFAQQKTVITRADELPRRSLQVQGKALELLNDTAQLTRLADILIANFNEDLKKYDIQDKATLTGYYQGLIALHFFKGEFDQTVSLIPKLRELENKPADKLLAGSFIEAYVKAAKSTGTTEGAVFKQAFEKNYAEAYAQLPFAEIKNEVESGLGSLRMSNPELILGSVQAQLQPLLDNTKGNVPESVPLGLIGLRMSMDRRIPLKDEMVRVFENLLASNQASAVKTIDIWESRKATLPSTTSLSPVIAAVWDSGVDMKVLPEANRFVNAKEVVDGKDNDGNGYVDDVNGIGYDLISATKSIGTLDNPVGKIKSDVKELQKLTKGSLDLQSAIQSPEAQALQKTVAGLKREQATSFQEELSFYGGFSHGTHVAGIVADGNPAIKVLGARMTWDYRTLPNAPSRQRSEFTAQMYRDTVAYFKRNGVKVVNMSWRYNSSAYEGLLTLHGIGKDEQDRKRIANEYFKIERDALYDAIRQAGDILFICGSGNENNDANFSEYIPASFDLPNLITIGAVDSEGKRTSFTTEGRSVDFYANGFEVESFVPGGDRLKFSGTSMASPQVANLAAKLLTINPKLKPAELVQLIAQGAESSPESAQIKLINPKRTLELAASTRSAQK